MLSSLEPLEERFRQVEEESERRAMQEPEQWVDELVDPATSVGRRFHQRKRSSVSVSRFGQPSESYNTSSSVSPPDPSSSLTSAAQKSTFYHSLVNPRSMDTFISEGSEGDSSHHLEERHVTQVKQIDGRQSFQKRVDAILPRRMSRSHSHNILSPPSKHLVIDVSVERTIMDTANVPSDGVHASVQATRVRETSSRASSTLAAKPPTSGIMQRAKSLGYKLGRKGKSIG